MKHWLRVFEIFKRIKVEYWLLAAIFLFAFFIRIYSLGSAPFWIDESISAIASKSIIAKGVPVLDSGMYYSGAHFFAYPQALSMLVFGMNELGARLVSVILGLLTIVLAYLIGREYSRSGAVIAALFFSVFFLEVFFSRQARHYQLFQLVFFLALYLLYKSRERPVLVYAAAASMLIAIDTQISGFVLVPFFILHVIMNRNVFFAKKVSQSKGRLKNSSPERRVNSPEQSAKQAGKKEGKNNALYYVLALIMILAVAFLVYVMVNLTTLLSSFSIRTAFNHALIYASYLGDIRYFVLLFLAGAAWALASKKEKKTKILTLYLLIPSLTLLFVVLFAKVYAFRYVYFFVFALVLYCSLFLSFLYEKYKHIILVLIILLIILPSNIFHPLSYVNAIKPVVYNYNDATAPEINYKSMPAELVAELRNTNAPVITFFSPEFEWYVKKPDYVLPFSMNGIGNDSVSWGSVDRYSGAPVIAYAAARPRPYYLVADYFSTSKLTFAQKDMLRIMVANCSTVHKAIDYEVYKCS